MSTSNPGSGAPGNSTGTGAAGSRPSGGPSTTSGGNRPLTSGGSAAGGVPTGRSPLGRPGAASGSGGSSGGGGPVGPDRGPGYQGEERYWTDYLRIAFPVLGLLLLLGLFWFWATELIDNNDEPNGTTVAQSTLTAGPSPTSGGGGDAPQLTAETTPDGEGSAPTETNAPRATRTPRQDDEEEPTKEGGSAVGQFKEDDIVVTTAEANLRSSPSLEDDNVVTTIPEGTELTVTGESVRADGYIWVPVEDTETGKDKGYMAEDNLEASE